MGGDEKGFTLIEALLVVGIFSIIALALTGMFQSARTGFDVAATQAYVQRTGTAVVEQMQRELTTAAALQIQNCGPQVTAGKSVMYMTASMTDADRYKCIYEWTASGDPGPQLYRCKLGSWSTGASCANNPENLLLIQHATNAPGTSATRLVAHNINFKWVTCVRSDPGPCTATDPPVVSPLFDVRFDLDMPGALLAASDSFAGQRFAASFTTRN